jgi:hypothetical protein
VATTTALSQVKTEPNNYCSRVDGQVQHGRNDLSVCRPPICFELLWLINSNNPAEFADQYPCALPQESFCETVESTRRAYDCTFQLTASVSNVLQSGPRQGHFCWSRYCTFSAETRPSNVSSTTSQSLQRATSLVRRRPTTYTVRPSCPRIVGAESQYSASSYSRIAG